MSNARSPRSVGSITVGTSAAFMACLLGYAATRRLHMVAPAESRVQPGGCGMVRREIVLPASQAEVWTALTRSEELSAWFGADVEIDPRPRGTVTDRHPDG